MNWDDVRYFLQLARDGSLSEASRSLAVEHTTIARRVAGLEASLGVRLFDRLPRGWRLTEDGHGLVPLAEAVEGSAAALERRATSALTATVRISTAPVVATHFLVPRLPLFVAKHPDINVELGTSRQSANLLRGDADLALRVGVGEVPPGLVVRELGKIGYGLYASPEVAARPLASRTFIGFDDTMRDTAQKHWLDGHAKGFRIAFRSNDLFSHYQAARAGLGIALLPHFILAEGDRLVAVRAQGTFERPLSLLFHPDARRAKSVVHVVRFVTDATKKAATLLASGARRARA